MLRIPRNHGLALSVLLAALLLAGCAGVPLAREQSIGVRISADALAQVGRPYRYGGNTPEGFDCSGLVHHAYLAAGITVPRTTTEQYRAARKVKLDKLVPGDLLFFRIDSRQVSHVAIYTGDGRFVHAPRNGRPVETRSLQDPYYRERLVAGGRLY